MSETTPDQKVGARIQALRTAQKMSQAELSEAVARLTGSPFHQQTILKIEKGTRQLRFTEAAHLAQALNVSIETLLSDDGPGAERFLEARSDLGKLDGLVRRVADIVYMSQQFIERINVLVEDDTVWQQLSDSQKTELRDDLFNLERDCEEAIEPWIKALAGLANAAGSRWHGDTT